MQKSSAVLAVTAMPVTSARKWLFREPMGFTTCGDSFRTLMAEDMEVSPMNKMPKPTSTSPAL